MGTPHTSRTEFLLCSQFLLPSQCMASLSNQLSHEPERPSAGPGDSAFQYLLNQPTSVLTLSKTLISFPWNAAKICINPSPVTILPNGPHHHRKDALDTMQTGSLHSPAQNVLCSESSLKASRQLAKPCLLWLLLDSQPHPRPSHPWNVPLRSSIWSSFPFPQQAKLFPASGPLYLLFLSPQGPGCPAPREESDGHPIYRGTHGKLLPLCPAD